MPDDGGWRLTYAILLAQGEKVSERPLVQRHQHSQAVPTATDPPSESLMDQAAPPSLPPVVQDADPSPPAPSSFKFPKNSIVRKKAIAIVAMRANGMNDQEIALALSISKGSVKQYVHRAVKAGLMLGRGKTELPFSDPHDRLEFDLAAQAVDNLKEMLTSDRILEKGQRSVRMETTFKMAEGVLFKKFDAPKETAAPQLNVLQIRIEGQGAPVDYDGGAPMYVDAEVLKEDK